jgi:dTDP-4-dehydrorhamnose reductase
MRILITGINGQVGGALVPRLNGLGTILGANRTVLDLSEPESIAGVLDRLAPDIIVNPAAYTAVDKAEDEPELAMKVNGEAPGIIARWAQRHRVLLIHFSTDYVFNGSSDKAWNERDQGEPLSVYGESKLAGENAIRSAGGRFLIIRTSWVYAAKGRNFLRTIARLAQERKELRVVADQIGAPTSAALIADAVVAMLAPGPDVFDEHCATTGGLVHLAARGETSWCGFASAIVEGLKERCVSIMVERVEPITTDQYPTRAARPRNSRFDLRRLHTIFGLTPPNWREALARELDLVANELRTIA